MEEKKNFFYRVRRFLVKPLVLPVMLLFTGLGFGLRPVHAKSTQMEQSFTVGKPLSSTKALESLIENQPFYFGNKNLVKKPIKVNKLTSTKGVLKRSLGTHELIKLFNSNPALKVLLITGGSISVELLSMPNDSRQFKWTDLLVTPKRFLLRHKVKIFGSIVIIGIVCYTIRERQYLMAATKKTLELVKRLESTSNAFEILKHKNQELISNMQIKIDFLSKANQDLVSNTKETIEALKKSYGSLVTCNSEIAELESLLYTAQTKFLECKLQLESVLSIPDSIRMDIMSRLNDQQAQLAIRLQRELAKLARKK